MMRQPERSGRCRFSLAAMLVLALSGCSTLDAINPFSGSSSGPKMAELTPIQATSKVDTLWQGRVGDSDRYAFTPLVIGNSVYVASRDGTLVRFDEGREVWRIKAETKLSGGVGGNESRIVVGSAKGDVLVFDTRDGKPLWQARASSEVLAPPAVDNDFVIVKSGDSRLFAFDAATGERKWVYQRAVPSLALRGVGAPLISQGFAFSGFPGGKLVAVSLTNGAAVWEGTVSLPKGSTELDRISDIASTPVIDGKTVCAVAYQGRVACFDLGNGSQIWSRELSSSAGLFIDNRYVYVTDDKGAVHALDRNSGTSAWKQDKLFLRQVSAPVARRGWVAVADISGTVHFLSREDGSFIARANTDGSAVQAPLQVYGSGVLVQTRKGGLYALDAQ